ncbi:MAG: hypothetical protein ACREOE_18870, partial [Gemmatimonadales bacterium]
VETACLTYITPYDVDQICASGYSSVGVTTMWVALLAGLAYLVWNYGYPLCQPGLRHLPPDN